MNGPEILTKGMIGEHIYFKMATQGPQLGTMQDVSSEEDPRVHYTVKFSDLGERFDMSLKKENCTADSETGRSFVRCS